MNRIEFMTELAALLQDISVEERKEAMQYYNDYFDDAGGENEEQIIKELGSPAKVAAEVKAGLSGQDGKSGEYRETGYTDTRFEEVKSPANPGPRTNNTLKIVLIILIILFGAPIAIPLGIGALCVVFGLTIALFVFFLGILVASVVVTVAGICILIAGITLLVPELAVGLALVGTGLILSVIGVIAAVASVKLCAVAIPGIFRGIVWLCRRPFQNRKVVA